MHGNGFLPLVAGHSAPHSGLDRKTAVLLCLAATVALDAALPSLQDAVAQALAAGARNEEIVATIEAVTPVVGTARVVAAAPAVALALGYDVEDALERLDT